MANQGYRDIGALQHKDGGGDAADTGYADIGALQHEEEEAPSGGQPTLKRFGGVPFVAVNSGPGRSIW